MGLLLFKKCFFKAIRAGEKTTTIRRWPFSRVRTGERVYCPGLGYLRVTGVRKIQLNKLRVTDARSDGFHTLGEMRAMLRSIYGEDESDGKHWWKISFSLE